MGTTKKVNTKKKKETELAKPLTKQEVKERISRTNYYDAHPDHIYEKMWKILTKKNGKWTDEETDYLQKNIRKIDNFSKSHVGLAETQEDDFLRTTIIELANDLIEQYDCINTGEKSLCEIIANSYWKTLQLSKKYTNVMSAGEYLSDERTRYLSMLWKEMDRANRHYFTSLNMLIEMKKPQMSINVKTKNAYFSQNQQINNNKPEDENIKD